MKRGDDGRTEQPHRLSKVHQKDGAKES